MNEPFQYFYFVSYAHAYGFGAVEVGTTLPVTSMADVLALGHAAAEQAGHPVSVVNFQLLRGPKTTDQPGEVTR